MRLYSEGSYTNLLLFLLFVSLYGALGDVLLLAEPNISLYALYKMTEECSKNTDRRVSTVGTQ